MAFLLDRLMAAYPYLYHLTADVNFPRIRRERRLKSAADLIHLAAGDTSRWLTTRRTTHVSLDLNNERVLLRDQAPLHAGNIHFGEAWDLSRFIAHLNRRVFFWPGDAGGPIAHGRRHHDRYAAENPVILRVALRDLLDANPQRVPLFCARNSGSPRTVNGKKSPRGLDTFVRCEHFPRGPRGVVEVTFEGEVILPQTTEGRLAADSTWSPVFSSAAD